MIQTVFDERRDDDGRLTLLTEVKLVLAQVLLLFHQVIVGHFVFKHGHVFSTLLHQCCILIGHFEVSSRDEEGLLLSQVADRRSR